MGAAIFILSEKMNVKPEYENYTFKNNETPQGSDVQIYRGSTLPNLKILAAGMADL